MKQIELTHEGYYKNLAAFFHLRSCIYAAVNTIRLKKCTSYNSDCMDGKAPRTVPIS